MRVHARLVGSLCKALYEPMDKADIKWVSIKTAFVLAITSAKRVGELHALSVSDRCMRWFPDGTSVQLWPNVSKVLPQSYVNKPITFAQYRPMGGEPPVRVELCPVRAIKAYIGATLESRQNQ